MTAIVNVEKYGKETRSSRLYSTYPIRLMESLIKYNNVKKRYRDELGNDNNDNVKLNNESSSYVTIFLISFGGGSVSGDEIDITLNVGIGANLCIRTQGNSKIYKSESNKVQQQRINCNIQSKGFLVMMPDHTVCFEDANYKQEQIYNLTTSSNFNDNENGSLVLVDWISSGRKHGGRKESSTSEIWKLNQLKSKIKLVDDKENCLFLDNIHLYHSYDENNNVSISIEDKVGGASIFGLIVLFGPKTSLLRDRVSVLMQRQSFQNKKESNNDFNDSNDNSSKSTKFFYSEPLVSVSELSSSLTVIRFASGCVESSYVFVKEVLKPLGKEMGFEPYADKVYTKEDYGYDWYCLKELRNYDLICTK